MKRKIIFIGCFGVICVIAGLLPDVDQACPPDAQTCSSVFADAFFQASLVRASIIVLIIALATTALVILIPNDKPKA